MGFRIIFFLALVFVLNGLNAFAQSDSTEWHWQKGLELLSKNQSKEALKFFQKIEKVKKKNPAFLEAKATALLMEEKFAEVITTLQRGIKAKEATLKSFQLSGKAYAQSGNLEKAFQTFEKGLKKFPNSGVLYYDWGIVLVEAKLFKKALLIFEKGIEAEPRFPENYYWATKLFAGSTESFWAFYYGEIFMNLERHTARTSEISGIMYQLFKDKIAIQKDSSLSFDFSLGKTGIYSDAQDPYHLRVSYGATIFIPLIKACLGKRNTIQLKTIVEARMCFLKSFYQMNYHQAYPFVMFLYQQQLAEADLLEPYLWWLFAEGEVANFETWKRMHTEKWKAFAAWFSSHPLQIEDSNRFHRNQY